eukprot:1151327-Pelagomonas_calceolata.AAC.1
MSALICHFRPPWHSPLANARQICPRKSEKPLVQFYSYFFNKPVHSYKSGQTTNQGVIPNRTCCRHHSFITFTESICQAATSRPDSKPSG